MPVRAGSPLGEGVSRIFIMCTGSWGRRAPARAPAPPGTPDGSARVKLSGPKFACYMWEKHTTDTGQSFGKDLGAARSRLGSAHDVMPRVVVVVIVIVVVVVQIPASREAELGRHIV